MRELGGAGAKTAKSCAAECYRHRNPSLGGGKSPSYVVRANQLLLRLNLAYEIGRLATESRYADFKFTGALYYRKGRPLRRQDRLLVERVRRGSPFEVLLVIGTVVGAGGGIFALAKALEKLVLLPAKRAEALAQARKVAAEADAAELTVAMKREERLDKHRARQEQFGRQLERREAGKFLNAVVERLSEDGVIIDEIKIKLRRSRRDRE